MAVASAVKRDFVPLEPFQRRFRQLQAERGYTLAEFARSLGWYDHRGFADCRRAGQALGFTTSPAGPSSNGHRHRIYRQSVEYGTAVAFCEHLGLDYWEAGV